MLQVSDFKFYVDASFAADLDTRRSTTGYVFKIAGGPLSWQSRMQTSVALSSMESEYMAASAAVQEAIWLNRLLEEMGFHTRNLSYYMKTTKQPYYFQIILVIIGDQSILTPENTFYVTL